MTHILYTNYDSYPTGAITGKLSKTHIPTGSDWVCYDTYAGQAAS
jgi:hypothetical protein